MKASTSESSVVILFREIDRDVGDIVMHDLAHCDLGARGDLAAPAEPDAGLVLERRIHGDFQPAGARECVFLGNGDPVRDYDELRQQRFSQLRDSLVAAKIGNIRYRKMLLCIQGDPPSA